MKKEHWIIILLSAVVIYLLVEDHNKVVTNTEVTRRNDSLTTANSALETFIVPELARRDSTITDLIKRLNNTKSVKEKHEKIRTDILAIPDDSIARLFSNRFSPLTH